MKIQYLRFALLAFLTLSTFAASAQQSDAQLLNKLRGDYGGDTQIQYSPDDASTRSRLFNLQTGQAGAFYNCDGEEDKRHSPYICWKNGPCGEKFHRPLWDVLDWRRDKNEIAQRICDGAGACCNSCRAPDSAIIAAPAPCGCAECIAAKSASAVEVAAVQRKAPDSLLQRAYEDTDVKSDTRENGSIAGLLVRMTSSVVEKSVLKPELQTKPCNCAQCKAKRSSQSVSESKVATTKAPSVEPVAKSRTASLLDRARSSRKNR